MKTKKESKNVNYASLAPVNPTRKMYGLKKIIAEGNDPLYDQMLIRIEAEEQILERVEKLEKRVEKLEKEVRLFEKETIEFVDEVVKHLRM